MMARIGMLVLSLLLVACGTAEQTPEQQIEAMLASVESAVESRSVSAVIPHISDNYTDRSGRDREALGRILAGYFLRNQSVHLLVQIKQIDLIDDRHARVELYVAMAGRPMAGVEDLLSLRAELHLFDLKLERVDGEWRLRSGQWRSASQADFL